MSGGEIVSDPDGFSPSMLYLFCGVGIACSNPPQGRFRVPAMGRFGPGNGR